MATWNLSFVSVKGNEYTVTIGGMSATKTLVPADAPLSTLASTSENPFEPIRGGTGYLRVIGNITEFDELFLSTPNAHKVRVYKYDEDEDTDVLVWSGFIKSEAYTLANSASKQVIEIPLIDTISVLSDIRMPSTWEWKPTGLGTLLQRMVQLAGGDIDKILVPSNNRPPGVFKQTIRPQNWVEVVEDPDLTGSYYRYKSLADILTDMAIAYGWSVRQDGTTWICAAGDRETLYAEYNVMDLTDDVPSAQALGVVAITEADIRGDLVGQSTISTRQGVASVNVENQPGKPVKELYTLDLSDYYYLGRGKSVLSTGSHVGLLGYYFGNNAPMLTCENSTNVGPLFAKFDAYRRGVIAENGEYNIGFGLEEIIWTKNGDYEKHVGISISPQVRTNHGDWYATIRPRWKINTTNDDVFLNISGLLKVVYNWEGGFVAPASDDNLIIRLRIGNKYLHINGAVLEWIESPSHCWLHVDAATGKISKFTFNEDYTYWEWPLEEDPEGALYLLPVGAYGDLEIQIELPTEYTAETAPVGYMLENFRVALYYMVSLNQQNLDGKANKYTKLIADNRDEYKIGGNLTVARGNQHGAGCITDEAIDVTPQIDPEAAMPYTPQYEYHNLTSLDITGNTPEVSLGNRIVAQMSTPYRLIKFSSKEKYVPHHVFQIGGNMYATMGCSHDWHREVYTYNVVQVKGLILNT